MKVYAVIDPNSYYGNKDIIRIFKIKKKAEEFIKFHPYELEIEEHELI